VVVKAAEGCARRQAAIKLQRIQWKSTCLYMLRYLREIQQGEVFNI